MIKNLLKIIKTQSKLAYLGILLIGLLILFYVCPAYLSNYTEFIFSATACYAAFLIGIMASFIEKDRSLSIKLTVFSLGFGVLVFYGWLVNYSFMIIIFVYIVAYLLGLIIEHFAKLIFWINGTLNITTGQGTSLSTIAQTSNKLDK